MPSKNRGRRESRVANAPAASRAKDKKHTSVVTTGSPVSSGLPCAMVLTVSSALSPVTGLSCHRRLANCFARLDASVGASGPHGFAVRVSAARRATPPASTASHLNVRDDAYAPHARRDVRIDNAVSTKSRSEIFFAKGLDRNWTETGRRLDSPGDLPVGQNHPRRFAKIS